MKRIFAVTAFVTAALALGAPMAQAGPAGDSVKGSGIAVTNEQFSIDASSTSQGKKPTGTMFFTVADPNYAGSVHAKVTCLKTTGNQAVIGGVVTSSTTSVYPVGYGVEWYVRDNGATGDILSISGATKAAPDCVTFMGGFAIQFGNLAVTDS